MIAYAMFRFELAFHVRDRSILLSNIAAVSIGILFFCVAYLIFKRRAWARYLAALLFSGVFIWICVDTFSEVPRQWDKLLWALPIVIAFAPLLRLWSRQEPWQLGHQLD
jgi:hypothetical protein